MTPARRLLPAALLGLAIHAPLDAQVEPYRLEGLVVTASPTPRRLASLSTHVTVLEGSRLRARGLTTVQGALRQVAGLSVARAGSVGASTSVFLRGGESDYLLVMVDGVQVNQPGGAFDFSALTLDNVERIEIVRGPQSALYGSDAVAGVIQIITRSGEGPSRLQLRARGGSYHSLGWAADLSGGGERASYVLGLSRSTTSGILPLNNGDVHTAFDGSADFRPDASTSARLSMRLGRRTYHFPTDGSGNVVDRNQFTRTNDAVIGLGAERVIGRDLQLRAQLGFDRTVGGTEDAQDGPTDTLGYFASSSRDRVRRTSADLRASYRRAGMVATLGWELEEERQRSATESRTQWGSSSDESSYERWNRAYYTYLSGTGGHGAFNLGGRLEDNERFGRLATWQAGGTWTPLGVDGPRLNASVGLGIKEPTFYENYATGFARGNPDLSPERSRSWEAGIEQRLFGGRLDLRASWFSQVFTDLIQYTATPPSPDAPNFYNVGKASARGAEMEARASVGALTFHGSWTGLRTRVLDSGLEGGVGGAFMKGRRLLRRPANTMTLGGTWSTGTRASVNVDLRLVGTRDDRDFSTYPAKRVTLGGYQDLTAGAELRVWPQVGDRPGLTVTVRGENLLNESYQEVLGFRAPGRALFLGVKMTLEVGR